MSVFSLECHLHVHVQWGQVESGLNINGLGRDEISFVYVMTDEIDYWQPFVLIACVCEYQHVHVYCWFSMLLSVSFLLCSLLWVFSLISDLGFCSLKHISCYSRSLLDLQLGKHSQWLAYTLWKHRYRCRNWTKSAVKSIQLSVLLISSPSDRRKKDVLNSWNKIIIAYEI